MAPVTAVPPMNARAPGTTNVVILSKIPEGITEQQIASGAGRCSEVLQVSYRPADLDGPGWAIVAFASPELAKAARERLDGKALPGQPATSTFDASLGEGLYGAVRRADEADSPWKEARTPHGQVYYYHAITRQTTWTKPPPEFPPVPPGTVPPLLPGQRFPGQRPPFMIPPPAVTPGRPPFAAPGMVPGAVPPPPPVSPGMQAQAAIQQAQAVAAAAQSSAEQTAAVNTGGGTAAAPGPVGANLFVYHIPNSWDDGILRQHFEHFGRIVSCRVQKDPDGRPRGFGFVSYDSPASAQAAIAGMHGFPVEGKWLKVQLKKGDEQQLDKAAQPQLNTVPPNLLGLNPTQTAEPGQPPPPPGLPPAFSSLASSGPAAFTAVRPGSTGPARPSPY